jgi:YhcH/YjgK/YiaL family protein
LVRGKEIIGYVDDNGLNEIDEDLLETRDLLFYKNVKNLTPIIMSEGSFCVFFPCDVHVPGCENDGEADIRKVVYKVNYALLEKDERE